MRYAAYLFAALTGMIRGALFLALLFFTGRAVVRRQRAQKETK